MQTVNFSSLVQVQSDEGALIRIKTPVSNATESRVLYFFFVGDSKVFFFFFGVREVCFVFGLFVFHKIVAVSCRNNTKCVQSEDTSCSAKRESRNFISRGVHVLPKLGFKSLWVYECSIHP